MPKQLVLTIAMGEMHQKISSLTRPSQEAYAHRIGADFHVIDRQKISETTPHWEKFQIFDLFTKYERIIYLDADTLIREDTPNLFELVNPAFIAMFNEAPYTDRSKELMIDICKAYSVKLPEWDGRYFNTGVIVASRCHKYLFRKPKLEVFNFYEQSYFNMMLAKQKPPIHELDYGFNRMSCLDSVLGISRRNSYVIHYAGFPNLNHVLTVIQSDVDHWKQCAGNYHCAHNIHVLVGGGLGDQVAAEPAVRFMRQRMYPDSDFIISTHWPEVYRHLQGPGMQICHHNKEEFKFDTPYRQCKTLPEPTTLQWAVVSHLLCHSVDFMAMALMRQTIPIADRDIKLDDSFRGNIQDALDSCGLDEEALSKLILIHPGRHWPSKTFPAEYWQEIIDGLVAAGLPVGIIGQDQPGDPPDYEKGKRGTVAIDVPDGAIDFRNLLDLPSLIGLISRAKVLVSNDSAPVHIAGAFDNWIVLLPSCKHPDHILPWRRGNQYHKAVALYKKLTLEDLDVRPTNIRETLADEVAGDWPDYLMDAQDVVDRIAETYSSEA